MGKIAIEVKGQTLTCENYTTEHAMFFGTLLMSEDELHIYINEEDPDRAFTTMSKRLGNFIETLKQKLAGTEDQEALIGGEVGKLFASRMLVRINQNRVPGNLIPDIRYEVAKRLREVFPLISKTWINSTAINLEPSDLISAVALPLFIYMVQSQQMNQSEVAIAPPEPTTQPSPEVAAEAIISQDLSGSTAGKGFKPTLKPPTQADDVPVAAEQAAISPVAIPPAVQVFLDNNPDFLVRRP